MQENTSFAIGIIVSIVILLVVTANHAYNQGKISVYRQLNKTTKEQDIYLDYGGKNYYTTMAELAELTK